MPGFSRVAAALALGALVSGCGIGDIFKAKDDRPCPEVAIIKDASRVISFRPGPGRDLTDVVFEARMPEVLVACSYDSDGVEVETALTIVGARGPANTTRQAQVRYFIAVLDPENRIVAKREFTTDLEFPVNIDRGATTEELTQRIPVAGGAAENYAVVAGFQLTREELEFNRTHAALSLLGPSGQQPTIPGPPAGEALRPGELHQLPGSAR